MIRYVLAVGLTVVAAQALAEDDADRGAKDRRVVVFTATLDETQLALQCAPKTERAAKTPAWVDACERLAQEAIDDAVGKGHIAPLEGNPFGMAATTSRSMPSDASIQLKSLGRKFKRIDITL